MEGQDGGIKRLRPQSSMEWAEFALFGGIDQAGEMQLGVTSGSEGPAGAWPPWNPDLQRRLPDAQLTRRTAHGHHLRQPHAVRHALPNLFLVILSLMSPCKPVKGPKLLFYFSRETAHSLASVVGHIQSSLVTCPRSDPSHPGSASETQSPVS